MSEIALAESKSAFTEISRDESYYKLRSEVEEFLYDEAELLDSRQLKAWLDTLAEDVLYFMPMTFNVKFGEHASREHTKIEKEMSWHNEGKWTLTKRVEQILTGVHWAEEPLSRFCRLISNIQITGVRTSDDGEQEIAVRSKFHIYQNRCEYEEYNFIGKREDVIRRTAQGMKLARREISLGHTVLLAKNLSGFF